jgi:hypothetical protein
MASGIRWVRPPSVLIAALNQYEDRLLAAVLQLARYFEPILEDYAKEHKPWQNRTGNAQQSLFTASELANDVVTLYLSHGVEYGIYLETRWAGKYAIILSTLQAHQGQILGMLQDLVR